MRRHAANTAEAARAMPVHTSAVPVAASTAPVVMSRVSISIFRWDWWW
ncbi:hypothetical protein ACIQU4_26180 [Streptomyces sp. NPDC090741]